MAKGYHHLTYGQRCHIAALRGSGVSITEIARQLDVHKSSISRELRRNNTHRIYQPDNAHQTSVQRRKNASEAFKKLGKSLISLIEAALIARWSPKQIAGWLKVNSADLYISFYTIYKHIREDKTHGGMLYKHLRHGGKKYNKGLNQRAGRGRIPNRVGIEERPKIVEEKTRLGDWEVDTIMSPRNGAGAIVSLVERHSKRTLLIKVASCHADVVCQAIIQALEPIKKYVLTITADNGKEFAKHAVISSHLEADFYFATPYHSWDRGLNEHTNGLVRQYLPKGTSFQEVSEEEVRTVQEALNNRPRKVLGYRTPHNVFWEQANAQNN